MASFFDLGKLLERKFRFLKYKDLFEVSVSKKFGAFLRKYKNFFQSRLLGAEARKYGGLFLRKYKKSFLLRKYKKFFNHRVRNFHFLKYKEFFSGWVFILFGAWVERFCFPKKIRNFFSGFPFPIFFLILELRSSIS